MATETSVQLYSVRDAIADDLVGSIDRVAAIGYQNVEPYGWVDRAPAYAAALKSAGLAAPSGHAPAIDSDDAAVIFDAAAVVGIETVIDPFIPSDRWQTADDAKKIAERVNQLSAQAATSGLRFGYHNHQWEFGNKVDGRSIYHTFVENLDPAVVLELDTFWSTVGGADTVQLLKDLGDRVQFIHVKDGKVSGDIAAILPSSESALVVPDELMAAFKLQLPAGSGDVDVAGILKAAPQALRVVEFDGYAGDVFEGIATSLAWLKANDPETVSA
ncbi:xylose isomerase [Frondihabitans sp. PAMC 28766]|uniref:sugar phosphate isomerase/epimerase family protein n=1 Tax=Frondihabitans sp. PAMC 28766 TaxID=1795630 RepID=UPI00078BBB52|nr:sugar phosphate isomerase/epimerase [Frondihabitans sp. PAMC 28766]AMM19977.1 xylose isomerase [Frondihabitans sp. PAMC 28766]